MTMSTMNTYMYLVKPRVNALKNMLLVCIILLSVSACIEMPKTVQHNKSLPFTEIAGYKFHTPIMGNEDDPVVIVIHGGPGVDHQPLKYLSPLSDDNYLVFYDQRGTGLSPRVDPSQLTVEQNLADLNLIVEHFSQGRKVKLIGHSWGAMLVSGYISSYPEKVSHAVIVEPGILNPESSQAFVDIMSEYQDVSRIFTLLKYMSMYPFIRKYDGEEGFDYVMTKLINRESSGPPYQCEGQSKGNKKFVRAGYDAFNQMLKPVMDDPSMFTHDLTAGVNNYTGKLMLISSECSLIGYDFQEKYHINKFPPQAIHVKAENMGHNMLTLNPKWSVSTIRQFLN
ncbi:alpha/beta fold hydrolase [Paraglaciecola marina]|uniref:alpha/beta fold hydrolase n=1 Tax=Paraglaciecola marina TaxID=2500157 RepID=UPI00105F68F2|nr:alpha/beta hydrolase [Paraglaciecola marina]